MKPDVRVESESCAPVQEGNVKKNLFQTTKKQRQNRPLKTKHTNNVKTFKISTQLKLQTKATDKKIT
jgi:hypothetical protein